MGEYDFSHLFSVDATMYRNSNFVAETFSTALAPNRLNDSKSIVSFEFLYHLGFIILLSPYEQLGN